MNIPLMGKEHEAMGKEAVIVSAVRTAIGRQGGALASVPPHVFGAEVIKEAVLVLHRMCLRIA